MPELPEVETLRRALQDHLPGRRIIATRVGQRQLRWPVPDTLEQDLDGAVFDHIDRRSKYLLMHTDSGCMIGHLGMSGSFRLVKADADGRKHDHIDWNLDDGSRLVFCDPRRFGSVHWTTGDPLQHRLLSKLGPEPLGEDFDADYLISRCANSQSPIKAVLMNSAVVCGIGNIYACEALFEAGLNPMRSAHNLDRQAAARLCEALKQVLQSALKAGGTSIRDFRDLDDRPGYFAQQLNVYGRQGLPCPKCADPVQTRRMLGRSTFFCRNCQP